MFGIFKKQKPVATYNDNVDIVDYTDIRIENKHNINTIVTEILENEKKFFILNNPQPFEIGDLVVPHKYGDYNHLGYISTGAQFIETFKTYDPRICYNTPLPIYQIRVSGEWIYDYLDCDWSRNEKMQNLIYSNTLLSNAHIRKVIEEILATKSQLFEWKVDFNWAELGFKPGTDSNDWFLNLRWGGFTANSFMLADSKQAKEQHKIIVLEKQKEKAFEKYNKLSKQSELLITEYKKIK